jgi:carboxyl-terminal processing protease
MKRSLLLFALLFSFTLSAADEPWRLWNSPVWKTGYRELTEDERVAGLALLWSEVKYNFANFDLVPALDWDAEFVAYVPRVRAAKTIPEYYRVMQELVAKLHDGHTYVRPPNDLAKSIYATPRLTTELIEGKVIVTGVYEEKSGIAAGDELLAIDGVPVKELADKRIRPYMFASTPQDLDNRTYRMFLLDGAEGSGVRLTFRNAGEKTLTRTYENFLPARPLVSFSVLEGNVGHLVVNGFHDDSLRAKYDELWPRIEKTSALIIDIRNNGGGNTSNARHILKTLTDKPFRGARWRTRRYLPSHRAWNRAEEWDQHEAEPVQPDGTRHYDKPVAVLIGAKTFSAAEDFSMSFDAMERGIFVGGPTGGSTGQPLLMTLPGGGILGVCTKRDQYPDGREFVGVGVQPDIAVAPSVADIRDGRDPVLARALAALKK